jgi:hypothetical protein
MAGEQEKVVTMSIVGDVRTVIQDLVSRDLKSIVAKLDAVDKKIDASGSTARHNELLAKLETFNAQHTARYDAIIKAFDIDARLQIIEERESEREKG